MAEALAAANAADEAADRAGEQAFLGQSETVAPEGETTPQVQPEQPEETPAAEDTLWDGTPVNPDELIREHPELAPLVKQLEGAFTRKTQDLAERRKSLEALGDEETLSQAMQLFNRIQDPEYWPSLHAELSQALERIGYTPAEASAEATRQMEEAATPPSAQPDLSALEQDPELAPLAQLLREQQSRLDKFEADQRAREEAEAAERYHMAMVGELTRQENAIRKANPNYEDEDVDMVYELSSFYGGHLLNAQERLEQYFQSRLARYLSEKEAAPTPASTVPTTSTAFTQRVEAPESIRDVEEEAVEYLRGLQAAGELGDF